MKVLLINGSPHKEGCTFTALSEVAKVLNTEGIETEIFHLGTKPIRECVGCNQCANNRCIYTEDIVNEALAKAEEADAYIFGSPVHYAAASGAITPFLDRFFYAAGKMHAYKPGAAVVTCRRGGASSALDQLNKYFTIRNMPVVSSKYWNMLYGSTPEEILNDKEGIEIMHQLGKNMAWLLKCIEAGKKAGVCQPQ